MKKLTLLALCAAMVPAFTVGLGTVSAADQIAATDSQRSSMPASASETFWTGKSVKSIHSSELIGSKVLNRTDNKEVGTISDLIVDQNGQIVAVVVGVGGVMGMGKKEVALSWQGLERSLNKGGNGYDIHANASEEALKNATAYKHN